MGAAEGLAMGEARRWLRRLIVAGREASGGEPLPVLGSPEWVDAESDRVKVAAAAVAATCWLDSVDPRRIAEELKAELEIRRQLADDESAADHRTAARAVLRTIGIRDKLRSWEAALQSPRPGDFPGGGDAA